MKRTVAIAVASLALIGCERTTKVTKTPFGETQTTVTKTPGSETTTTKTTIKTNKDDPEEKGGVKVRINAQDGIKVDVGKRKD